MQQQVQAIKVIKWMEKEMPPLTWNIIGIKMVEVLMQHGIKPTGIDEKTIFNEIILAEINKILIDTYKKELPKF